MFPSGIVFALCLALTSALAAQSVASPRFEVASVKANRSSDKGVSNFPLGPGDVYGVSGNYFSATNFPLITYIAFAYKVTGPAAQALLQQAPKWVTAERFDITARAEGRHTKDQMRQMMQLLLAERFKLVSHEEVRQTSVAELVIARSGKLGPQLQLHPADADCPANAGPLETTADHRFPLLCGGLLQMPSIHPGRVRYGARNMTLAFLAKTLSGLTPLEHPLNDQTGLSGTFDFQSRMDSGSPCRARSCD
jgi:uncharacterized protein (TIGR03435 family)